MPQAMLFDAAAAIIRGEVDVAVVAGAECIYTRRAARRAPDHPALNWGTQDADTPPPVAFGTDRMPVTELELARGIVVAIDAYPLMENALRGARVGAWRSTGRASARSGRPSRRWRRTTPTPGAARPAARGDHDGDRGEPHGQLPLSKLPWPT